MNKIINNILESFDIILNENKSSLNEVSSTSSSLFGGSSVKIPSDGAHKGQSGWQSNNAWDIPTPIGSPVYAVADGVVATFTDYGPTPIRKNGKTLFGAGFTVNSSNGLPNVYYTHLKDCTISQGSNVKCGQLLGYIMDFPGSDYDHLHIGVETGHNIKEFLNANGTLKCGGSITGELSEPVKSTDTSDSTTQSATTQSATTKKPDDDQFGINNIDTNAPEYSALTQAASKFGLKEEKIYSKLGNRISVNNRSIILPKNDNYTIKSPVNGVINNYRSNRYCVNQLTIQHSIEDKKYYLQFCNISHPQVNDGRKVSKGDVLGKTSTDVTVSLFDKVWNQIYLNKMLDKEISTDVISKKKSGNNKDIDKKDDNNKGNNKKETEYYDPIYPWLGKKIFDIGKKIQDKMPSMTKGGEPKTKNFFNKYGMTNKKVDENIERIKTLLK